VEIIPILLPPTIAANIPIKNVGCPVPISAALQTLA
jgi:hypothetical protein